MTLTGTRKVKATPGPLPPESARQRAPRWWRDRFLLAVGLPGLCLLLLFQYVPLAGNVIAFQDYQPFLGFRKSDWVGFANFAVIFNGDPAFINALINTLIISLAQILFVFPVPIALALLLNSLISERFKRIVQSVLYLPHFMSWVIVVAIFQQMLGPTGVLNAWLRRNGYDALTITTNPDLFIGLISSQVLWRDAGWSTILFLAALTQIDQQLYEAAAVDGAGRMRQLWHVTLPGIRGVIILLLILRLGDVLTVGFEQILLQQPAVGLDASDVLDTYVYRNGILGQHWGVAAAVGLVKGLVGVVMVLGANRLAHAFGERGLYSR